MVKKRAKEIPKENDDLFSKIEQELLDLIVEIIVDHIMRNDEASDQQSDRLPKTE